MSLYEIVVLCISVPFMMIKGYFIIDRRALDPIEDYPENIFSLWRDLLLKYPKSKISFKVV